MSRLLNGNAAVHHEQHVDKVYAGGSVLFTIEIARAAEIDPNLTQVLARRLKGIDVTLSGFGDPKVVRMNVGQVRSLAEALTIAADCADAIPDLVQEDTA